MEEKQIESVFAIPANYTDSGRILGGMVSVRNAIETVALVLIFGFVELKLIPMSEVVRIVVMAITLIPLAVISITGIDGDSLLQRVGHAIRFVLRRKKFIYRSNYYEKGR